MFVDCAIDQQSSQEQRHLPFQDTLLYPASNHLSRPDYKIATFHMSDEAI